MAGAFGWFEMLRQVRYQVRVEDAKLVGSRIRYNHLCDPVQLPVVQLLDHPLCDVCRVMTLIKGTAAKHQSLPPPVRCDVIW